MIDKFLAGILFCLLVVSCKPKATVPLRPDVSELTKRDTLNWMPLGPFGSPIPMAATNFRSPHGTGRFMCIQVQAEKPDEILIGHATSGIFKTDNGGLSWNQTMSTNFASGVFKILRFNTEPKHLLAATALDIGPSRQYGYGLIESFDNGATWTRNSLKFDPSEYSIEQTRDVVFTDIKKEKGLLALTSHSVHLSSDGGQVWQKVYSTEYNLKRAHVSPIDPKIIFLTGNAVLVSKDGGINFNDITPSVCSSYGVRNHSHAAYQMAFSSKNPNDFYIVAENQNVFLLKGHGTEFSKFELINVGFAPMNASRLEMTTAIDESGKLDVIWVGTTRLVKSDDGGITFIEAGIPDNNVPDHIHDDINQILVSKGKVYVCTDGGVDVSLDQGKNWKSLTDQSANLNGALIFGFDKSKDNTILAGTQDNGLIIFKDGVWKCLDMYGDGGRVVSVSDSDDFSAGFAQLNYMVYDGGAKLALTHAGAERTGHDFRISYQAKSGNLYMANMHLYKKNAGKYFEIISSSLDNNRKIKAFWVNPSDENEIWLAKDDPTWGASLEKKLYHTTDGGKTWIDRTKSMPILKWRSITDICVGNNGEIAIALEAFDKTADGLNKIYISKDNGRSFTNVSDGLPNLPVNCLIELNGKWICGTNDGVYILTNSKWNTFGNGFPKTIVTELKYFEKDKILMASTFGRGLWSIAIP